MSKSANNIIVLGAGGLLGTHVLHVLKDRLPRRAIVAQQKERFSTSVALHEYLSAHKASTIVNCIGYLGADETSHYRINGCLPRALTDWCTSQDALCLHVSTNAVFAPSESRHWLPHDNPAPSTPYEISKAFSEDPRAYVVRASFLGRSPKRSGLYERLLVGQPYVDRLWNGVSALVLAERLAEIVADNDGHSVGSIEHVHAPDSIRFSEIATLLNSSSPCQAVVEDARLLGGGHEMAPIRSQFQQYLQFAAQLS